MTHHSFKIFWKYPKDAKNMATERIDPNLLACVNASLCNMCRENRFYFVDNSKISVDNLFKDKLHLLDSGKTILANNFIYCINNYLLLTHTHRTHIIHTFDRNASSK